MGFAGTFAVATSAYLILLKADSCSHNTRSDQPFVAEHRGLQFRPEPFRMFCQLSWNFP